jgi:tRNA pseudouridine32 synthase/23S rRNA pseudouridine746 synthase
MSEPTSPLKLQFEVTEEAHTALDLLSARSGLSRQRIKDAMNKGAVWWARKNKTLRLRRATQVLASGTRLQLFYDANVLMRVPEPPLLVADAGHYSVWFKPHGLLSQGSQWGDHCSVLRWAEVHLHPRRPAFLVHRLDADAAGLILIAHDAKSAARLSQLFQEHRIQKYYQVQVNGLLQLPDTVTTIARAIDGKSAVTHVRLVGHNLANNSSQLDVHLETGRKHQIRRHLADIGNPIIGDRLYGTASKQPLQLLAYRLAFRCPFTHNNVDYVVTNEQLLFSREP